MCSGKTVICIMLKCLLEAVNTLCLCLFLPASAVVEKNVRREMYNWKNVRLLTVSEDRELYWKFIVIQLFNESLFVSYSIVPLTYLQQIHNTTVFGRSLRHLFARSLRSLFASSLRHLFASSLRHLFASSLRHLFVSSLRHLFASSLRHLFASSLRHLFARSLRHLFAISLRHLFASSLRHLFARSLRHHPGVS
jgi:hypothetical protein